MHGSCAIVNVPAFFTQKHGLGKVLLDEVFRHLELVETDFFGLAYNDRAVGLVSPCVCVMCPLSSSSVCPFIRPSLCMMSIMIVGNHNLEPVMTLSWRPVVRQKIKRCY